METYPSRSRNCPSAGTTTGWMAHQQNSNSQVAQQQKNSGKSTGSPIAVGALAPGANPRVQAAKALAEGRPLKSADPELIPGGDAAPGMPELSPPTPLSKAVNALGNVLKPFAKLGSGAVDLVFTVGTRVIMEQVKQMEQPHNPIG